MAQQKFNVIQKTDITGAFAANFDTAKYAKRFVTEQKIREGGVKWASVVKFPHSVVQSSKENVQSLSGTSFQTFPIAMISPSSLKVN